MVCIYGTNREIREYQALVDGEMMVVVQKCSKPEHRLRSIFQPSIRRTPISVRVLRSNGAWEPSWSWNMFHFTTSL